MSDIENPPPSGSASGGGDEAATPAEPNRHGHGLWAWKERVVALHSRNNPQQLDDGGEVATVDADQTSRCIFVHFWSTFFMLLCYGFLLLMVLPIGYGVASAATSTIAIIGMVVTFCCAGFFIELGETMDHGSTHRVIDSLI